MATHGGTEMQPDPKDPRKPEDSQASEDPQGSSNSVIKQSKSDDFDFFSKNSSKENKKGNDAPRLLWKWRGHVFSFIAGSFLTVAALSGLCIIAHPGQATTSVPISTSVPSTNPTPTGAEVVNSLLQKITNMTASKNEAQMLNEILEDIQTINSLLCPDEIRAKIQAAIARLYEEIKRQPENPNNDKKNQLIDTLSSLCP